MNKPRIRKWGKSWECFSREGSCLGITPREAYLNWLRHALRKIKIARQFSLQPDFYPIALKPPLY